MFSAAGVHYIAEPGSLIGVVATHGLACVQQVDRQELLRKPSMDKPPLHLEPALEPFSPSPRASAVSTTSQGAALYRLRSVFSWV